jgi:hypothetical protein
MSASTNAILMLLFHRYYANVSSEIVGYCDYIVYLVLHYIVYITLFIQFSLYVPQMPWRRRQSSSTFVRGSLSLKLQN